MKRGNDVFFFTLIDFLVQVFFFGLVLVAAGRAAEATKLEQQAKDLQQLEAAKKAAGVSSLNELTDALTKLGPLDELKGTKDFISKMGGRDKAAEAVNVIAKVGGIEEVQSRLKAYDDQFGLPPCVSVEVRGKRVPVPVAVLRLEDSFIEIESYTADFSKLLREIGVAYSAVKHLRLDEFDAFARKVQAHSDKCRYFVDIREITEYHLPFKKVYVGFRIAGRK
jgi:hypothetical protein